MHLTLLFLRPRPKRTCSKFIALLVISDIFWPFEPPSSKSRESVEINRIDKKRVVNPLKMSPCVWILGLLALSASLDVSDAERSVYFKQQGIREETCPEIGRFRFFIVNRTIKRISMIN